MQLYVHLAYLTSSFLWFLAFVGTAAMLYAVFGRHVVGLTQDLHELRGLSGSRMTNIQMPLQPRPPPKALPAPHAFEGIDPSKDLPSPPPLDPLSLTTRSVRSVRTPEVPPPEDDACDLRVAELDLEHAPFCLNGAEPLVAPKNHWWGSEFDVEYLR